MADLGCGSGYFTVPISRKVKKVYGIDVQKEMLEFLEEKIQTQKILNIETLRSKENEIPLQNESVDLLLSVNTLHEFHDAEKIINEIRRVLKPDGQVAIIDFKKEKTGFGPPVSVRVSKEQTSRLFEKQGLTVLKAHELKYHYLMVFRKSSVPSGSFVDAFVSTLLREIKAYNYRNPVDLLAFVCHQRFCFTASSTWCHKRTDF